MQVVACLLQFSAGRRPSVATLLASKEVQRNQEAVQSNLARNGTMKLFQTIRVHPLLFIPIATVPAHAA